MAEAGTRNRPALITTWQIFDVQNCSARSVGPIGLGNYPNSNNPTRLIDYTLFTTVACHP